MKETFSPCEPIIDTTLGHYDETISRLLFKMQEAENPLEFAQAIKVLEQARSVREYSQLTEMQRELTKLQENNE